MTTSSSTLSPTLFDEALAPWFCRGEVFLLYGYTMQSKSSYPPQSAFSNLEGASSYADPCVTGEFKGGLSSIAIIRYTDTPIGPYDELIWIPGKFTSPPNDNPSHRIGRMYVSSRDAVYNGRRNWNFPRQLAHFSFTPNPDETGTLTYTKVSVAPISNPDQPFFVADFTTTWITRPILSLNTLHSSRPMWFTTPPLPQSINWYEDGRIGTTRWCRVRPIIKGKMGLIRCKGGLEDGKFGDDLGFPDVHPFSLGMWLPDAEVAWRIGMRLVKKVGTKFVQKVGE